MHTSLARLLKWGAIGLSLLLLVTAVTSASSAGRTPSDPPLNLYLPLVMRRYAPPPPPTSFDLIASDEHSGKLDAETALQYKVFAVFGDARLPAAYQGGEVGGEAGLYMNEVVAAYPTLSASAKAVVAPFFTPPFLAGSWRSLAEHSRAPSAPGDWAFLTAAGGKARVWYKAANPEMQRKAGVIAAAVTGVIWPNETELMGREPVPDAAGVQNIVVSDQYRKGWNSSFVPFTGYAGMAVPQKCGQSASILYINSGLHDQSLFKGDVGLIETTAHEFMHALQFSFPLAVNPCIEYGWLGETTAAWTEDFAYPDHDSEWRVAEYYLNDPWQVINDRTGWRDYGQYVWAYYYTHYYNNPGAVRQVWTQAGYYDSLIASMPLGNFGANQLAALWNQEPFDTFLKDEDGLPYHIKAYNQGNETLTAAGSGFKEYAIDDASYPGSVTLYHYKVDPSVHTLTILNGLSNKLSQAPADDPRDMVYKLEDLDPEAARGAEVVTLVKLAGIDEPWMTINTPRQDYCQDWLKQRVSELLVIVTNQDMTDRTRQVKAADANTRIIVSSVPCLKLTGSAKKTIKWSNVTEVEAASGLEWMYTGFTNDFDPRSNLIDPDIDMHLTKGNISWQISGTDDNGCSYSGSESFGITEWVNPSHLTLYYNFLPFSRRFMGYQGTGGPDSPYPDIHYTVSCPDEPTQNFTETLGDFFMPDGTIPVTPAGLLQGDVTVDDGAGTVRWEWNFQPAAQ